MSPRALLFVTTAFTWSCASAPPAPPPVMAPPNAALIAPNIGSGQLAIEVNEAPYRPTLPAGLNALGSTYMGMYKICVNDGGAVVNVSTVKSAHPQLDPRWMETIKLWRYRPYTVDGKPTAFCYTLRLKMTALDKEPGPSVAKDDPVHTRPLDMDDGMVRLSSDITSPPHMVLIPPQLDRPGNSIWGLFRICVGASGNVERVTIIKSADETADEPWTKVIQGWRYRPLVVDGTPIPFCYTQRLRAQSI